MRKILRPRKGPRCMTLHTCCRISRILCHKLRLCLCRHLLGTERPATHLLCAVCWSSLSSFSVFDVMKSQTDLELRELGGQARSMDNDDVALSRLRKKAVLKVRISCYYKLSSILIRLLTNSWSDALDSCRFWVSAALFSSHGRDL